MKIEVKSGTKESLERAISPCDNPYHADIESYCIQYLNSLSSVICLFKFFLGAEKASYLFPYVGIRVVLSRQWEDLIGTDKQAIIIAVLLKDGLFGDSMGNISTGLCLEEEHIG